MITQKEWSEREEKAFQLGRADERKKVLKEVLTLFALDENTSIFEVYEIEKKLKQLKGERE